ELADGFGALLEQLCVAHNAPRSRSVRDRNDPAKDPTATATISRMSKVLTATSLAFSAFQTAQPSDQRPDLRARQTEPRLRVGEGHDVMHRRSSGELAQRLGHHVGDAAT
ncbi:MAG: hypothetical protein EBS48_10885, partial [Actinobacteria bacterium]|nr:hypothetical protein [Actinomycetota bacterium]